MTQTLQAKQRLSEWRETFGSVAIAVVNTFFDAKAAEAKAEAEAEAKAAAAEMDTDEAEQEFESNIIQLDTNEARQQFATDLLHNFTFAFGTVQVHANGEVSWRNARQRCSHL